MTRTATVRSRRMLPDAVAACALGRTKPPARTATVRSRTMLPTRAGAASLPRTPLRTLLLSLLLSLAWATAQSFSVGLVGAVDGAQPLRVDVGVAGAQVGATTVDLALAVDGAVQLDLGLRANETFVPLGNVIFEGRGALRSDGTAAGSLGARGVLGPVALGLNLSAFGADAARFDPLAIASAERPAFGRDGGAAAGWGVALRASGRPTRALIVELAPAYYATGDGAAWRLDGRLRWLRAIGVNELSLRWHGSLGPGPGAAAGALGVGFTVDRRRAPDLDVAAFVGASPAGWRPGLTADLAENLGGGVTGQLGLALEPYRLDVPPYRLRLGLTVPTALGSATVAAAASAGGAPAAVALRAGLTMPVTLPAARP